MKYLSQILSLGFFLFLAIQVQAQHDHGSHNQKAATTKAEATPAGGVTDIFMVSGNCGMCERRIEGALTNVKGVQSADWDVDTKVLTVKYDDTVISLDDIKKKVAEAGHDTDKFRAKDEVYSNLPGCCQYDRPAAEKTSNVSAVQGTEASLTVYGNCGMCKRRIEGALIKMAGVNAANWDAETQVLSVNYDAAQTNLDEIQKTITRVGHDTDKYRTDDKVYENLPGCCQYDRPKG
ncbi:MAG: cation transporter [Lewinellaceae bacterium]|nr:cation transporter [Saprospiraceae bacterium]MCB9341701.1 cation transporter [Lewinellaceae bacterium]